MYYQVHIAVAEGVRAMREKPCEHLDRARIQGVSQLSPSLPEKFEIERNQERRRTGSGTPVLASAYEARMWIARRAKGRNLVGVKSIGDLCFGRVELGGLETERA